MSAANSFILIIALLPVLSTQYLTKNAKLEDKSPVSCYFWNFENMKIIILIEFFPVFVDSKFIDL